MLFKVKWRKLWKYANNPTDVRISFFLKKKSSFLAHPTRMSGMPIASIYFKFILALVAFSIRNDIQIKQDFRVLKFLLNFFFRSWIIKNIPMLETTKLLLKSCESPRTKNQPHFFIISLSKTIIKISFVRTFVQGNCSYRYRWTPIFLAEFAVINFAYFLRDYPQLPYNFKRTNLILFLQFFNLHYFL